MLTPDIKASNILQEIEDESILDEFKIAETETPSERKVLDDRTIYRSRRLSRPKSYGRPVLCDFGEARHGEVENDDDIQPDVYRAPEVILEMPWSYSVDIWNVGVMVKALFSGQGPGLTIVQIWDLFENEHLFDGIDPERKKYTNRRHLGEMVAFLGPPPKELLASLCKVI